jgi:hypothetical protein
VFGPGLDRKGAGRLPNAERFRALVAHPAMSSTTGPAVAPRRRRECRPRAAVFGSSGIVSPERQFASRFEPWWID